MSLDLVALPEIAQMLGISRQRASKIMYTHPDFPKPEAELSIGKVWVRSTVDEWARTRSRLAGGRGVVGDAQAKGTTDKD